MEQTKLTAANYGFGGDVNIDGDTALIGASGAAYVFVRSGGVWTEQATLTPSDGDSELFGAPVSIDGDTALIGATRANALAGAAYVYVRSGTVWTEQTKLTPSDGEVDDHFGSDVSLDGDTALIGAEQDDDNAVGSGSAYIFGCSL